MGIADITQLIFLAKPSEAAKPSAKAARKDPLPEVNPVYVNDSVILTSKVANILKDINFLVNKHKDLEMQIKIMEGMKYGGIAVGVGGLIVACYSSALLGGLIVLVGAAAAVMARYKQPAIRYEDANVQIALADVVRQSTPAEKKLFIGIVKDKDTELGNIIEMLAK